MYRKGQNKWQMSNGEWQRANGEWGETGKRGRASVAGSGSGCGEANVAKNEEGEMLREKPFFTSNSDVLSLKTWSSEAS